MIICAKKHPLIEIILNRVGFSDKGSRFENEDKAVAMRTPRRYGFGVTRTAVPLPGISHHRDYRRKRRRLNELMTVKN
jgi:hypothetical protein